MFKKINSFFLNPNTILFFWELDLVTIFLSDSIISKQELDDANAAFMCLVHVAPTRFLQNALATYGVRTYKSKKNLRYQLLYLVMDLVFKSRVLEVALSNGLNANWTEGVSSFFAFGALNKLKKTPGPGQLAFDPFLALILGRKNPI